MTYLVQIEVAGPLAMFARPDTGVTPTSYPVPTRSAAKGIFEAIAMLGRGNAWIAPTRVEVCKRRGTAGGEVRFQRYTTNYGGPLRKSVLIPKGTGMQVFATVLVDVCYRIYGELRHETQTPSHNARHHLQELFQRRLKRGQCHHTPVLGWSEFTCNYWGAFRSDNYEVDTGVSLTIPSMLSTIWDRASAGRYAPVFAQEVKIDKGALTYAQ